MGLASYTSYKVRCSDVHDWLILNSCDCCLSIFNVPVDCCLGYSLSFSPLVVVLLDHGHSRLMNVESIITVDVVRVKSYLNIIFSSILWACKAKVTRTALNNYFAISRGFLNEKFCIFS